jgi:hydroxymethylglutaryl-CoA lyase
MIEGAIITDVGPRDGLQNQPTTVSTSNKLRIVEALVHSGIRNVEVASFVSAKAVPQMADADDLFARITATDSVTYSALVLNERGYERALTAGVRTIAVAAATTETMNARNARMSRAQALNVCREIGRLASKDKIKVRAYIATAFVCPFEGPVDSGIVATFADQMSDAGINEVVIADTIGMADPVSVAKLFDRLSAKFPKLTFAAHFHDTQGMGLANCFAALERGVRRFDSSLGGMGGCPFAPGAAGNVATEDLVNMLERAGYPTGINLDRLSDAIALTETFVMRSLGGRWLSWKRSRL